MIRKFLALVLGLFAALAACAQPAPSFDTSATNLMVVLRESEGANKSEESLVPMGKMKGRLPDGREIEVETAWYSYVGDMHVRFVFDTPTSMPNASADDLRRLGLTPEAALKLSIANIKRVYGAPKATPWNDLMQVSGTSPDLNSSYFLDHEFWSSLLKQHPEGIVAAVVKRGGLLYSPLSNEEAVNGMRRAVGQLYLTSERMRISSALYLFRDGKWSVFQGPLR
jgi:hypothetical protein